MISVKPTPCEISRIFPCAETNWNFNQMCGNGKDSGAKETRPRTWATQNMNCIMRAHTLIIEETWHSAIRTHLLLFKNNNKPRLLLYTVP